MNAQSRVTDSASISPIDLNETLPREGVDVGSNNGGAEPNVINIYSPAEIAAARDERASVANLAFLHAYLPERQSIDGRRGLSPQVLHTVDNSPAPANVLHHRFPRAEQRFTTSTTEQDRIDHERVMEQLELSLCAQLNAVRGERLDGRRLEDWHDGATFSSVLWASFWWIIQILWLLALLVGLFVVFDWLDSRYSKRHLDCKPKPQAPRGLFFF